jgi:hypothetical protein
MTTRRMRDVLWGSTIVVVVLFLPVAWRLGVSDSEYVMRPLPGAEREVRRAPADSARSMAARVAEHDPFRIDHRPAAVSYRPDQEGIAAQPAPPPKPPKPRLSLSGIVGGPPWTAILDSVPGRDGSVLVRKGDTLGGLKVRSVGRDTVIVQGADTVWKLIVKRPWQ